MRLSAITGIDVPTLENHVDIAGSIVDFPGATGLAEKDELLFLTVDLLFPAAVEGVISAATASRVQAKFIVEAANGPTNPEADALLAEQGCASIRDILANEGGVVVSYFECVQANQAYWWSPEEVETRLEQRMKAAWDRVNKHATRTNRSLRESATSLAVQTVAEAHRMRGLYP